MISRFILRGSNRPKQPRDYYKRTRAFFTVRRVSVWDGIGVDFVVSNPFPIELLVDTMD